MRVEVAFLRKFFSTFLVRTCERFFSRVSSYVNLQRTCPHEFRTTLFALIRPILYLRFKAPFARVDSLVVDEVANRSECLPAGIANIRPLSCMDPQMYEHIEAFGEVFAAAGKCAFEALLATGLQLTLSLTWVRRWRLSLCLCE